MASKKMKVQIAKSLAECMSILTISDEGYKISKKPPDWDFEDEHIRHKGLFVVPKCVVQLGEAKKVMSHSKQMEIEIGLALSKEELEYSEVNPRFKCIPAVFNIFDTSRVVKESDVDYYMEESEQNQVIELLPPEVLSAWMVKIQTARDIWDKYRKAAPKLVAEHRGSGKGRNERKKFIQAFVKFLATSEFDYSRLDKPFLLQLFLMDADMLEEIRKFIRRQSTNVAALYDDEMDEVLKLVECEKVHKS